MKVIEIINDAYRFGKVIPYPGYNISSEEITLAERLLRTIINKLNIDGGNIALNSQETFTLTASDSTISLAGYIELLKVQYLLGNVRQDVTLQNINDFYDQARVLNTQSIPYLGYAKRTGSGIDLNLYFTPISDYTIEVNGVKGLNYLTRDDELTADEQLYESWLTWELARYLRRYKQLPIDREINAECATISQKLRSIKPTNSIMKTSYMGRDCSGDTLYKLATSGQDALSGGWKP